MNPYQYDTLMTGMLGHKERFIGPQDEVALLLARVSDTRPRAISLVGPWRIGKSFIFQFLSDPQGARHVFPEAIGPDFRDSSERLLFVTIDSGEYALEDQAAQHLLELMYTRLLHELARLLDISDARLIPLDQMPSGKHPSVAALRAQIERLRTQAQDEADEIELRERFVAAVGTGMPRSLLTLLKRVDDWGLRIIFLLDRFDAVAPYLDRVAFDHLRSLIPVASLIVATRKPLSEQIPTEVQTSPFFNLLERLSLMNLHLLSAEEARRMIIEPPTWHPETADFRFSASDITFILELTGRHPDIIRVSCTYLYRWVTRHGPVAASDLLPVSERRYLRALLRSEFTDAFAVLWHSLTFDERTMLVRVATHAIIIDERQDVPPPPIVSALINRGYIVFDTDDYHIFSGLFHDYVLEQDTPQPLPAEPLSQVPLTELESRFLDILKTKSGTTVDRREIIAKLYGVDPAQTDIRHYQNRLDTLVSRLRPKLELAPIVIENVRGQGYRLVQTK